MDRDWAEVVAVSIGLGSFLWAGGAALWLSRLLNMRWIPSLLLLSVPAAVSLMMFTFFLAPSLSPAWWGSNWGMMLTVAGLLVPFPLFLTMMIAPVRRLRAGAPRQIHEVFK